MKRSKRIRRRYMSKTWAGNSSFINTGPLPLNQRVLAEMHNRVASVRGARHAAMPFSKYAAIIGYQETWHGDLKPIVEVRPNTWLDWFPTLKRTNIENARRQYVETYQPIRLSAINNRWKIVVMYFMGPRAFLIMHEPLECRFRMSIHYSVVGAKEAFRRNDITWIRVDYYSPPSSASSSDSPRGSVE